MSKLDLIVCGHVGRSVNYAEVNGKKVCNFSVAHSVGKDNDQKTIWIEFAAWGKLAEICKAIELKTGDKVTVYSNWLTAHSYSKDDSVFSTIKATVEHIEK